MIFNNPLPNLISDHSHDNFEIILCFFLFWTVFYIIIHLMIGGENTPKMLDTKNRVVSIVHGLLSLTMASIDVFLHKSSLNEPTSNFQGNILLCSLGYFLYDLIACKYYGLFDMDLLIHHTISGIGLSVGPFFGYGGTCAIMGIVVTEVSNFPMHLRTILKNFGLRHTKAYEYLERAYFILYIIARTIFGPWLFVKSVLAPKNNKITSAVCLLLCLQSFMFIKKMMKIIKAKIL